MNPHVKEILTELAQRLVHEADVWETVYGKNIPDGGVTQEAEDEYSQLVKEVEEFKNSCANKLISIGYPVYTVMITGCSPSDGPGNYEVEDAVVLKFGDRVLPDSEHSQLFIMTTPADQDEVLAYVREVAGVGKVYTYGGDVYDSEFHAYDEDTPHIAGLGNWSSARKFLEDNKI